MITDLWIENFKGIGQRQHIPLRPITLLFGANSAGKSSVLHALLYFQEVLRSGSIDLSKPLAGAQTVNLGGIQNLLNSRDGITSKTLKIGLRVSPPNLKATVPSDLPEEQQIILKQASSLFPFQIDSYDLHLTVGRNLNDAQWRVTHSEILINSESFMRFSTADDDSAVGTVNLLHPALSFNLDSIVNPVVDWQPEWKHPTVQTIQIAEQGLERYRQACNAVDVLAQTAILLSEESDVSVNCFMQLGVLEYPREIRFRASEHKMIESLLRNQDAFRAIPFREYIQARGLEVALPDEIYHSVSVILDESEESRPLPVAILFGQRRDANGEQISSQLDSRFPNKWVTCLRQAWVESAIGPDFDAAKKAEQFDVQFFDFGGHAFPVAGRQVPLPAESTGLIREAKTHLLQFVAACTLGLLERLTYLGPKRATVPRNLNSDVIDEFSSWGDGLGAWRWLLHCEELEFEKCNEWLSQDATGLNTGFNLEREDFRELAEVFFSMLMLKKDFEYVYPYPPDVLEQIQSDLENSRKVRKVTLRDIATKRKRHPQDVGEGITQVIPVIAALVRTSPCGFCAIEQPELHLHPSLAAKLGDLAISTMMTEFRRARALIETHSEHLILRILRRIRQTTDGELPEHIPPVKPDDVCVLWVDNLGDGTTIQQLRIDERGEFIDRWPAGFFSERAEELF